MVEQAVEAGLDEGKAAQPVEQLVGVGHAEAGPQQVLGGDPGEGAHLEGPPVHDVGDDVDEPPQQGGHQVGGEGVEGVVTATSDHIRDQRQAERVAVGRLEQPLVGVTVDPAAVEVLLRLLRS